MVIQVIPPSQPLTFGGANSYAMAINDSGEAAGSAAALALSGNTTPRDIAVEKLQQALQQQGAFIGRDQAIPMGV